jgi:hypothetical protein
MAPLTFKVNGDSKKVATLRKAILAKLPVLVLQNCVVHANTSQYDCQFIEDRLGNVPVNSLDPKVVGTEMSLDETNSTTETLVLTPRHFKYAKEEGTDLFPPIEFRTYDGEVHSLDIPFLELNPGETVRITFVVKKALSGDDGRYKVAPVCHFKGMVDQAAAAKAYEELPEETKTPEYRKNWEILYSHQFILPNTYTFSVDCVAQCGYTNEVAVATACEIIIDSVTRSKMLKVTFNESDDNTQAEIVMDDFVGYLFESELFGKPGVKFVNYSKRHPHDEAGTLRLKLGSPDVNVAELLQSCIEPLRRFYLAIASGPGKKTLHPTLQKAFDSFKRATPAEKRERLIELGASPARTQNASDDDLDTMTEVWLRQTEKSASPALDETP